MSRSKNQKHWAKMVSFNRRNNNPYADEILTKNYAEVKKATHRAERRTAKHKINKQD